MKKLRYRIAGSMLLIVVPVGIGVCGFMLIESYTFLEALYMSVITIATVGYGEVHPLSNGGKIFTIFLIITNLGVFAYAISLITSILIQGEFFETFRLNKMKNRIGSLKGHVIVCGYGRNGKEACAMLARSRMSFVVLESNLAVLEEEGFPVEFYLADDATRDEALLEAGIRNAKGLITTLPEDAHNVFVSLTARELNPDLIIVSRASSDSSVTKLKRAGANNVIMPDKIGGAHMASLILHPDVKEFIDIISGQGGAGVQVEEISLHSIRTKLTGDTLNELNIRHLTGVNVIGLKSPDGTFVVNPDIHEVLKVDSKLIMLGTSGQMEKLRALV